MRAKYRVIERFKDKYPIQKMCEIFEVSRSGFYKWRKRMLKPERRSELDQIIIECQAQVKQTYGYRRVWLWMKQNKSVKYHPLTVLQGESQILCKHCIAVQKRMIFYDEGDGISAVPLLTL